MNRFIKYPTDVISFGKHKGKSIKDIIDTDRNYFLWMLTECITISHLIYDYCEGKNPIQTKTYHSVDTKRGVLTINKRQFYVLKKEKGVRKKDHCHIVSDKLIGKFNIDLPYTEKTEKRSEWRDYTKFHNDCELVEWEVTLRIYDQKQLSEFVTNKLKECNTILS